MKGPGPQERPSLGPATKPYLLSAFSLAVEPDSFLAKVRSSTLTRPGVAIPSRGVRSVGAGDRLVRRASPSKPGQQKNLSPFHPPESWNVLRSCGQRVENYSI